MVGDEDHGAVLDRLRDPLRARLRLLLPLLLQVLPLLTERSLDKWAEWLIRQRDQAATPAQFEEFSRYLAAVREHVLDRAQIEPDDTVVDVGAGTGLLTLGALERLGEDGQVIALDISVDCLEETARIARDPRVWYQVGSAEVVPLPDESVDAMLTRSVLMYVREKAEAAREFFRVLRPGGRFSLFEPLNRRNTRLWDQLDFGDLQQRVIEDHRRRYPPDDPMMDFDADDLERYFAAAGFTDIDSEVELVEREVPTHTALHMVGAPGRLSLVDAWRESFAPEELERLVAAVEAAGPTTMRLHTLFLAGRKP